MRYYVYEYCTTFDKGQITSSCTRGCRLAASWPQLRLETAAELLSCVVKEFCSQAETQLRQGLHGNWMFNSCSRSQLFKSPSHFQCHSHLQVNWGYGIKSSSPALGPPGSLHASKVILSLHARKVMLSLHASKLILSSYHAHQRWHDGWRQHAWLQ